MMTSTSRRRRRKAFLSSGELIPPDLLSFEVDPSLPTTKVATTLTGISIAYLFIFLSVALCTFMTMIIDCSTCTMAAIACNTCVVSFFLDNTSQLSDQTVDALSVLAESGLTPPLQFNARGA